ncbi:hypothetical protein [Bacillus sp. NEB1478]|uniref:NUDIX hydrolase n=1 Tax=Bacillus sp. NEB1478 TaxID=3073816 RepID=UPI002873C69E|nr:hypothetical protein [Bacillus sp. NEB1478]WNB91098.1 hypothetical protein RGB74_14455 [Bacillus sp. NEB1478]
MKPTVLTSISKPIKVKIDGCALELSAQLKLEIEHFWKTINVNGSFRRGEVFHVHSIDEHEDRFDFNLRSSDYAHYLHTVRSEYIGDEGCKVIYGAGLAETKDSFFVFGEMADHTAYPGRLQCVGGGLDEEDMDGEFFDIEKNVLREMAEELGIEDIESRCHSTIQFIKTGGMYDFIAVLFHIKLDLTLEELQKNYESYCDELIAKGEQPEFKNLVTLKNESNAISEYLQSEQRDCVDYLFPFLEQFIRKA